jgi:class 3 adenylate cyclase/tetratricopeptide (TPR) repeat protein
MEGAIVKCPECQFENREGAKFCSECGHKFEYLCPECGISIIAGSNFCDECGCMLESPSETHGNVIEIENSPIRPTVKIKADDVAPIVGERKHITVLFSDLSGYTAMSDRLDPEEVKEIMSWIFGEIAQIVTKYEAFIEKFVGDAVMVLFGVPKVHEDDPVRAIKAAREIHDLVKTISSKLKQKISQPLNMHSGINTGLIVTGEIDVEKGTHGAVGDTLNIASRLADIARPGEILVGSQTLELIAPYFETKPLEAVSIKGKTKPITPYLVVRELVIHTRFEASGRKGFTPFTGRRQELVTLHSCLEKVVAGNGQFVTVVGEAGVGKSRLVFEFRHSIDRDQVIVLQGRCQSYGSNIPYLPFLNALKRGLHLGEDDSTSELEKKAVSNILAIDQTLEQFLPFYLHLLSIPSENHPLPKNLHGIELKNGINKALAALNILNSKRQPMVLIFEDWHWADKASDSTLRHLVSLIASYPLMVVVMYRPEYSSSWSNWSYHTPIVLKPLDNLHIENIIKAIWEVDYLPDGFASLIHEHTGGNPFFIEEVCTTLTEEGTVRLEDRKAAFMRSLEQLSLPSTVQAVLRARLDRLDHHTKEVLQLASVVGREFASRILEQIFDSGDKLSPSLETLKLQELIHQIRLIPEAEYMFKHVLTQVVVYETILLKRRKKLHAAVGQAIEELYYERLEEQYENLAYHYSNSTDTEKALYYLEMAGDKATRVHSLTEARKHYEKALSIFNANKNKPEHQQKFIDLTLKWAEVSQFVPSDKIREALKLSLNYAQEIGNKRRVAGVSYWIGRFAYVQGDFIEALPQVKRCIKWAMDLNDQELLATSYNLIGRSCLYTDEYSKGIRYLEKGLNLIRPYRKWDDIVYSSGILGLMLGLTGDFRKSIQTIEEAIELAKDHGILTFEAMVFGYLGSVQFWYGKWQEAIDSCSRCAEISKRLDNSLPISWSSLFKGAAIFNSGRQDKGLRLMREAIHIIAKTDSVIALRFFFSLFAECLAVHGDNLEAESVNQKAQALNQSGQKWGEIISCRTLALLATAKSRPDWNKVDSYMKRSIQLAKEKKALPELVVSLLRYADLLEQKGDKDRAESYWNHAQDLAKQIGCRIFNRLDSKVNS